MNFLKTTVLPLLLSLVMAVSFMVVPSSAVFGTEDFELPTIDPVAFFDKDLLESEMIRLFGDNSNDHCAFFSEFAYIANKSNWVETSKANLVVLATQWNQSHGLTYSSTASVDSHTLDDGTEISFIRVKISDSRLGGSRTNWTWCLNDGAGKILVALPETDSDKVIPDGSHWIAKDSAEKNLRYSHPMTGAKMKQLCTALELTGEQVYIANFGTKYKAIYKDGREVFAGSDGYPFVSAADDAEWAVNQSRPQTDSKEQTEDIVEGVIDGLESGIDLGSMTLTLPNGFVAFIDDIIYDESTKSYHIDSHDTYNTTINNYYTWNYYINYTSITYIGQTEEYNKYYEVYYELPDGRDSADLTKEDLEQLNLSVDVIPYGRSADDTSLRSLYHFDGDTKDSSYWNYCTDFTWNQGASLTYMDAGVFDGALYLDETEHDFSMTLPSNIGAGNFTLQFRYYQSATIAPQTDSYMKIGGNTVLQFNGGSFLDGSGTVLSSVPVGTWNELALVRVDGVIYYFLNGVVVGSVSNNGSFAGNVNFKFGSGQQTFKYFDEFRFVNKAVYPSTGYEPTSVPHDTNLSLILPTDSVPVADEYWDISSSGDNLIEADWTTGVLPSVYKGSQSAFNNTICPSLCTITGYSSVSAYEGYTSINSLSSTTTSASRWVGGLGTCVAYTQSYSNAASCTYYIPSGTYTFSVVLSDGSVCSHTATLNASSLSSTSTKFDWGQIGLSCSQGSMKNYRQWVFYVLPNSSVDIIYMELVSGSSTDLSAEFVSSVVGIDKNDLNTPTLAVRTDIDITSYQIGGVRLSIPEKGQVWAMVENDRIVSIQIYNGQAWEGVDGRIWTGQRWIPASSYNIITLQDMYDIVDATPNYEYIYSEAGFWAWWQKSWNAFTEKLFLALGSGGSGGSGASGGAGSSELNKVDLDSAPVVSDPDEEDGKSLWQFIILVVDGGKSVVTGTRELFSGVVSTIPDTMDGITGAFDSGGIAVGIFDGSDPDAEDIESEVLDPWRYQ